MGNITLKAPSGVTVGTVVGADGVAYAVTSGEVTLPQNAAASLFAAGWWNGVIATGATGGTGSTGATGATGATGPTGATA